MHPFGLQIRTWAVESWEVADQIIVHASQFLGNNWTYALAVFATLVGVLAHHRYRRWHQSWLSALIDIRIKELGGERRRGRFETLRYLSTRTVYLASRSSLFRLIERAERYIFASPRLFQNYYFPSLASFVLVAAVTAAVFYLPHYLAFENLKLASLLDNLSHPDVAQKIFEGLALIAVGLIIFVAESIRDAQNPDYKRVLLRISYLWPLTLAVTLFPLGYLAGDLTGTVIVLLFALVAFFIYAFSNVLRNLLDPDAREQSLKGLLKDRIRSLIMDSVRERVGNNILLQMLGPDKELALEYLPPGFWTSDKATNYVRVYHAHSGWLCDINLDDLRNLVRLVNDQYRRLNEIGHEQGLATAAKFTSSPATSSAQAEAGPIIYLLKRFGEQLAAESLFSTGNAVLAIPRELSRDAGLMGEIRRRTSHAFKLTTAEPSSIAFRREIRGTKDRLIAAIRSVSIGAVEDLRGTFLEIAEEFLKTLHELGGGYSADQARQERSNIFEGWNEIRWLVRDTRELLIVAAETNNSDVIGSIAFLPFAIATRAVVARDHLLFEEFTPFATFVYELAAAKPANAPIRQYMIDRSWRYLFELCEYYVLPFNLDIGGRKVDIGESQGFAVFAIKVFQDISKAAFDKGDISTFQTVLTELSRLFQHFNPQEEFPDAAFLKARVAQAQDDSERVKLQEQLDEQTKKENAAWAIRLARREVVFGLAAHIVSKCIGAEEVTKNLPFYEAMEPFLPDGPVDLTNVFIGASSIQTSEYFGWSWWDSIADGEAHWIDTHTKVDRLYIIRLLKILARMSQDQINLIELPAGDTITMLLRRVETENVLPTLYADAGPDSASKLLTDEEIAQADNLLGRLRRAKERADRAEEDELIAAPLDEQKVVEFRTNLLEAREKQGHLRALMIRLGAYADNTDESPPAEIAAWGFNRLDDKGAFVDQSRVSYSAWGQNYGQAMARSENSFGFKPLLDGAGRRLTCAKDDLFETLEVEIERAFLREPIIVHSLLSHLELIGVGQGDIFIPKYRNDCPRTAYSDLEGFSGVFNIGGRNIPVFSLFTPDERLRRKMVVADFSRFACWHQYVPIDDAEEAGDVYEAVSIQVSDLNADDRLRTKIIEDNPEWLRDKPEKERYLRGRVVVRIYERFEMEVIEAQAGIAIEVTDLNY